MTNLGRTFLTGGLVGAAALALMTGCAADEPSAKVSFPLVGSLPGGDHPETTWDPESGEPACSPDGIGCPPRWGHISPKTLFEMNQAAVKVGCTDPILLSSYPEDRDGSYWFTCADGRWLGNWPTGWWRDRSIDADEATPIGDLFAIVTPVQPELWPTPGEGPF